MLLTRLVIFAAIAASPALAQISKAPTPLDKIAPRQHLPIKDKAKHRDGTVTSTNWSGYAVTGSSFTSAEGSWTVPVATCPAAFEEQYSSFWVGIDGYSSSTVEQTGTDSDCLGNYANYYAWYEFYPNPTFVISSVPVAPGDVMSASVVYSDSEFTVTITNETTGQSYSTSAAVPGADRSSAEWIAEAPCCTGPGGILPLSDFGTGYFGEDTSAVNGTNYATDSTNSGVIGSFPSGAIEEINKVSSPSSPQASSCSALSIDGTSFSCIWAPLSALSSE